MADHLDLEPQLPAAGLLRLHRVTERDWRSHRDLRRRMLLEAPDAFWVTHADVAHWGEAQWREATTHAHYLQARDTGSGAVLGMVGILPRAYGEELPLPEDAVNLIALYVVPEARGRGVGELLLAGGVSLTRTLGRRRILLEAASNNEPAIGLYRRCGYQFTGRTFAHPRRTDLVEREMVLVLDRL